MKSQRSFVVLGAGTIGKIVARDLFESHPDNKILIADYNGRTAEALAESFNDRRRAQSRRIDATQPKELTRALYHQDVVINCLQHDFNLGVMEAALADGVHYVDLGGLFYWTRKQLRLKKNFEKKGLTAIIGMGCSPGITNVLAAHAASRLDKIRSIKIRVGSIDFGKREKDELRFCYSAKTIVEELTLKPWIFRNGEFHQIAPRTGWEFTEFPAPVGLAWTLWTRHSEIATLPLSFKEKGVKYCDFKVGFDRKFVREVMKRLKSGWTTHQFNKLVIPDPNPNDYEISRVIADDLIVDCHAKAKPEWQASAGDVDTACPASITAQMIADGLISERGVFPPEKIVPIEPFFTELKKRDMKISVT